MRKVLLKRLTMTNFKGEPNRTTMFGERETTIAGKNGVGKSRHFDAFLWLLFGKDHLDRKDYEVKTRIGGEELHKVDCTVEGLLLVDGVETLLKRSLVEDWVKPRGTTESVFKGNHTDCWWNDSPVQVGEYQSRVEEIIKPEVFKMLTNPRFFPSLNWKIQREQLFQLAGTVSDAQIAGRTERYALLLEKIGNKSFNDFKAEISAKKRRLKDELAQIQPRIDQTEKMKPAKEDYDAIQKSITELDAEIADINNALADISAGYRKAHAEVEAKHRQIHALELDCIKIVCDAQKEENAKAFRGNEALDCLKEDLTNKRNKKRMEEESLARMRSEVISHRNNIKRWKDEQEELRNQWREENAKEWNGETTCHACGQPLPEEKIAKSKEIFNLHKVHVLEENNRKGRELGEKIRIEEAHLNDLTQCEFVQVKKIGDLEKEIADISQTIASNVQVEPKKVVPSEIPAWNEKQKEIEAIKATLTDCMPQSTDNELKEQLRLKNAVRDPLVQRLSTKKELERCEQEIVSLEERGKALAQQIADIEADEFTAQEFTKIKIEECESRINRLFNFVTFRLFDHTIEGNEAETCIPLVNGVPYGSANSAGQVNAGLDIINALCRFHGVCAPIFIDNRESTLNIVDTESQIINLVVTNDNEMKITQID